MRLLAAAVAVLVVAIIPPAALAAGGSCPSGSSYLDLANPAGAHVPLSSFGVSSCYYVSAAGTDSNAGTSESSPWLHAPGMPSCTGACAAVTPSPGDGYIFRGGDTWHTGNAAAAPYTGGTWSWTWSGTASNNVYIGVDPTWFSGAAWARPILNGDNPLNSVSGASAGVASCAYGNGGANLVSLAPANYEHFDDFELVGMCWGAGGGSFIFSSGLNIPYAQGATNPNPRYIENNYIHGWSHEDFSSCSPSGGVCASDGVAIDGAFGGPGQDGFFGAITQFNVIDGSDSDSYSLGWIGNGDCWIVQYNVVRYNGADNSPVNCHLFHDNLFEWGYNADDGQTHTDWPMQIYGGEANSSDIPGDGTPNLFYNNIVRHIPGSVSSVLWQFPPPGYTDYDFNNVFSDYEGTGNYNDVDQGSGRGNLVLFNNTEEGQGAPNPGGCIYCNSNSGTSTITSVNNHWILSGGESAVFQDTSVVTESAAVYQSITTATGEGYTVGNDFAPTSASGDTVTASGTNETTGLCALFTDPFVSAACLQGITGVAYDETNHAVIYSAHPPVARPAAGAWNVGAYQWTDGGVASATAGSTGTTGSAASSTSGSMAASGVGTGSSGGHTHGATSGSSASAGSTTGAASTSAGATSGGTTGTHPDGGTGTTAVSGCGCTSAGPGVVLLGLVFGLGLVRRRR